MQSTEGDVSTAVDAVNRLTARWAATLPATGSTVLSGAALWPLLGYLAGAADGRARDELSAALGTEAEQAAAAATAVLAELDATEGVTAAFALWRGRGLPLAAWWREHVRTGVTRVWTGDPGTDLAAVRDWLQAVAGDALDADAVRWAETSPPLALTAALSLDGPWLKEFLPTALAARRGPWRGRHLSGLTRTTRGTAGVAVHDSSAGRLTVVTLDTETQLRVHLVCGRRSTGAALVLPAAVAAVTGRSTRRYLRRWTRAPGLSVSWRRSARSQVTITLPAFGCSARHNLLAAPALFGLSAAGTDTGHHFPGLTEVPLAVARAQQDVRARFTATGFTAAAVSAVVMRVTSAPPSPGLDVRVRLDRPFGVVVQSARSPLVLLAAWIGDAEQLR